MKKIFLLLSIVSVFGLTSCNNDDDYVAAGDGDTIAESWIVNNVNFLPGSDYSVLVDLSLQYEDDVVLVYRQVGVTDSGNPIWQILPQTWYPAQGEVDYVYNFDVDFIELYVQANYDLGLTPEYTTNQRFKFVVVPAYDNSGRVDYSNYDALAKQYNIKESDAKEVFVKK